MARRTILATVLTAFSLKNEIAVSTIKLIVLLAIEAPVACLCILMMSAKLPMVKKDHIEASRTIAGALTRAPRWWRVPLEGRKSAKINEI